MKHLLLSIVVILFSFIAPAQNDHKVSIGHIDSLESTILGEQRKIWVYLPDGGHADEQFLRQNYPLPNFTS